jgi:hypothetical protein
MRGASSRSAFIGLYVDGERKPGLLARALVFEKKLV